MQLYRSSRLKSICKFKEEQVADTLGKERASATENIKVVQIHQLPKEYLQQQIITWCRYIRKVNPSSLHLFQSRYTTKQEKDYAIQRIGVGFVRRSWAGVHSLFWLVGCSELNSNLAIQYTNLIESGYVLAFLVFSCYTITRYKTRKNKVLQGFRRFPA